MSTTPQDWTDRMISETAAAEQAIEPGDAFAPHDGESSDLNILTPDLLAGPDASFDPTLPRSTT